MSLNTFRPGQLAVVVGAGRSGRAACRLLARDGLSVRLLEADEKRITQELRDELLPFGVEILTGAHKKSDFAGAAWIVPSPAMPLLKLLEITGVTPGRSGEPEILAETELAFRHLTDEPVIAVTGTSGKTTTVSLVAAMLREAGKEVFLGGNIGTPLSEYVLKGEKADVIVLEMSSFQLQACSTFHPRVGVILNITPNHLDYHHDMAEYIEAKFRLFRSQTADDLAILEPLLREQAEAHHLVAKTVYFQECGRFTDLKLIGRHNKSNAEAAWQACAPFGVSLEAARRAAAQFNPLPHRLEKVCEKGGVLYVNDSKCTTVSSMETALLAMERPVLLLCGGRFKGGDLKALLPIVRDKVRQVAGFGESKEIFEAAWAGEVPMHWFATLRPAVDFLHSISRAGDVMLLAPGTSSFDLYPGMAFRGEDFKKIVKEFGEC